MSKKIKLIVCITIFFVFLFPSSQASSEGCKWLPSHLMSKKAYPIATPIQGGSNSEDNPKIGVKVVRCSWFTEHKHDMVLEIGEVKNPSGHPFWHSDEYRYLAMVGISSKTCNNKCAYAQCDTSILLKDPLNQCYPPESNYSLCDPQLTSITLNMCAQSSESKAVGICAYKSDKTIFDQALSDLWNFITNVGIKIICPICVMFEVMEDPSIVIPPPPDFSEIDCFPVPGASLPYPFCTFPIKVYSPLTVLKMCEVGEAPYRTLSGSIKECVYPSPASPPNTQSTFMQPCVRVTYDNPKADTSVLRNTTENTLYKTNYSNYYGGSGLNYELLYVNNSSSNTQFARPDTKVRFSTLYNDVTNNATPIPLTLFGYNDANYIDICGTINLNGSITMVGNSSLIDQNGNQRNLKLTICKDPETGENTCIPNSSDIYTQKDVCVFETVEGKEIFHNCVQRPQMPKPSVSFCDNIFNDKSESCMSFCDNIFNDKSEPCMSIPALRQKYKFGGDTTNCRDTQLESTEGGAKKICTIQQSNPYNLFGFQAILTNRCYMNALSIAQHGNTAAPICYKNASPCQMQISASEKNCNNCNIDEYCAAFLPPEPPSLLPSAEKITGAERLCLYGYTGVYTQMAEPWCQDQTNQPCNRVCANTYLQTFQGQTAYDTYIDVGNRTMPPPATLSPLPPPSCAYSIVTPQDQAKYRVRNPVEEGLCVDAYTIKFNKKCAPQNSDPYFNANLCSTIKTFCSKTDNLNQHYTNFDECQTVFKTCLGSDPPTGKQTLSDGTTYTCDDIQTFATTSDTFKAAKAPLESLTPAQSKSGQ